MVSGVEPGGQVDAFTAATPTHSFVLDDYLKLNSEKKFVLCIEINAVGDATEKYPDFHLGQPSLLYTALIAVDDEQPYTILELTGHGGNAEKSGAIQYDLEQHSTAKELIELALAKVEPLNE